MAKALAFGWLIYPNSTLLASINPSAGDEKNRKLGFLVESRSRRWKRREIRREIVPDIE